MNNRPEVLSWLADRGAIELDKPAPRGGMRGMTPAFVACMRGHLEAVELLATMGADLRRATTVDGDEPTHAAAANNHIEVLKFLKRAGTDMDVLNANGITPIIVSAHRGHTDILLYLARRGCSLARITDNQMTALSFARAQGHHDLVCLIEDILSAGGYRQYAAARRMPYVRIRHEVSSAYLVLDEGHDDRALLHLVFGRNRAAVVDAAAVSHGERLEEAAEDGAEKSKAMHELPDAVFSLVCRFLVS